MPFTTTHGLTCSSEYYTWNGIKQRCHNPKNPSYPYYGAKGITVCERWFNSFEAFYSDMGPKPGPEYSIERKDGAKGYEPGNCKWATQLEQIRNRPCYRRFEIEGEKLTAAELAEKQGTTRDVIYGRMRIRDSFEEVVNWIPKKNTGGRPKKETQVVFEGRSLSLEELSHEKGLDVQTVRQRLVQGWDLHDAVTVPKYKHRTNHRS